MTALCAISAMFVRIALESEGDKRKEENPPMTKRNLCCIHKSGNPLNSYCLIVYFITLCFMHQQSLLVCCCDSVGWGNRVSYRIEDDPVCFPFCVCWQAENLSFHSEESVTQNRTCVIVVVDVVVKENKRNGNRTHTHME